MRGKVTGKRIVTFNSLEKPKTSNVKEQRWKDLCEKEALKGFSAEHVNLSTIVLNRLGTTVIGSREGRRGKAVNQYLRNTQRCKYHGHDSNTITITT